MCWRAARSATSCTSGPSLRGGSSRVALPSRLAASSRASARRRASATPSRSSPCPTSSRSRPAGPLSAAGVSTSQGISPTSRAGREGCSASSRYTGLAASSARQVCGGNSSGNRGLLTTRTILGMRYRCVVGGASTCGAVVVGPDAGCGSVPRSTILPLAASQRPKRGLTWIDAALMRWSNQSCTAFCLRVCSEGSSWLRSWSSSGGSRTPVTCRTCQPNSVLTGPPTGEAQSPLVRPLQLPLPARATAALSNAGTVEPLLWKPRSPPRSLDPGSIEERLATAVQSPPWASSSLILRALASSLTSTWRTRSCRNSALRLPRVASSSASPRPGTSLAEARSAAACTRSWLRRIGTVRLRWARTASKLPPWAATCCLICSRRESTSASDTVTPSCLAPLSTTCATIRLCRASRAPPTAWDGSGCAPAGRPAFTCAVSSSMGMATPSTTAAWFGATRPGPQPAASRTSRTRAGKRRTDDLTSSVTGNGANSLAVRARPRSVTTPPAAAPSGWRPAGRGLAARRARPRAARTARREGARRPRARGRSRAGARPGTARPPSRPRPGRGGRGGPAWTRAGPALAPGGRVRRSRPPRPGRPRWPGRERPQGRAGCAPAAAAGRSGRPARRRARRPRRPRSSRRGAGRPRGAAGGQVGVDRDLQLQLLGLLDRAAAHLGHCLGQHLHVEVVADQGDVAGLVGAEQVVRAADLQVLHRDGHAGAQVLVGGDRREALVGGLGDGPLRRVHQVGVGALAGAADAAAELVQLGEAEGVGAVDDQRVGRGDVDARLDDGGAHQHVVGLVPEVDHDPLELLLAHLAVG